MRRDEGRAGGGGHAPFRDALDAVQLDARREGPNEAAAGDDDRYRDHQHRGLPAVGRERRAHGGVVGADLLQPVRGEWERRGMRGARRDGGPPGIDDQQLVELVGEPAPQ